MSTLTVEGMYTGTYMHSPGTAAMVTKTYTPAHSDGVIYEKSFYTSGNRKSTGLHTIRPDHQNGNIHRSGEVVLSEDKETTSFHQDELCESITPEEFEEILDRGSPYLDMHHMMSTMKISPTDTYVKCTSFYDHQHVENYKSFGPALVQHVGGLRGQPFDHAAVYYNVPPPIGSVAEQ